MTAQILAGDTETTGAGADDRVVELAWTEIDADLNEIARVHSLIDPQRPISASASGVHGITADMLEDKPTIDEFFGEVLHPPLGPEIILICHKVDFDRRMLEPTLNKFGIKIVAQMCTLRAARRYLPDAENHKLATLMYQYGLDRGESHRADGDVLTLVSLLRLLVMVSGKSLLDLIEEDKVPLIVEKWSFGKHRGQPIKDTPSSYCDWALNNMKELDPDLRHTLELKVRGRL